MGRVQDGARDTGAELLGPECRAANSALRYQQQRAPVARSAQPLRGSVRPRCAQTQVDDFRL